MEIMQLNQGGYSQTCEVSAQPENQFEYACRKSLQECRQLKHII